jgi:nicotinamide-nucleotide amidase
VLEGSSLSPVLSPLQQALGKSKLTIAVAESCTGGLVAAALTDLPGSSEYFLGGMVAYANAAKIGVLGVDEAMIRKHGAVSRQVAAQMAVGARKLFGSDVAVSVTGVAGPSTEGDKPVGLTYIAVSYRARTLVRRHRWNGGRASNRLASVEAAIQLATEVVS